MYPFAVLLALLLPCYRSLAFPDKYQITAVINSKITVSWEVQATTQTLAVALRYSEPGWVGIGWNRQRHSMKYADMFVAEIMDDGVVVRDYWSAHSDDPPDLDVALGGNNSVLAQRGVLVDGILMVEFIRPLAAQDRDYDIELIDGEELTMLLGWGDEPKLAEHKDHPVHMQVDMYAGKILTADHQLLRIIHGVLQALAWALFLPLGGIVARYKIQLSSSIGWFTLHKILQGTGIVFCLTGFVIAFLMNFSHFDTRWHAQLGTALVGLMLLQAGIALLRPKNDTLKSPSRVFWERTHLAFGILLPIIAICTMNSGLYHLTYSFSWSLAPFAWGVFLIVVIVALEYKKRTTEDLEKDDRTL